MIRTCTDLQNTGNTGKVGGMNYTPIYACFFADGEIIGYTTTAEGACDWAGRVAGNHKAVRIVKIYEMQAPPQREVFDEMQVPPQWQVPPQ